MKFSVSFLTAVCALTVLPGISSAQDQPWLQDRRYTEGIGYRVGDLELHPGLAAEFGYDSNYLRRAEDEFGGPVGTLRLRITPSFSLATLSKQRREVTPGAPPPDIEFRAGVSATYNEFFQVSGPDEDMSELRSIGGLLSFNMLILPERPWSFALFGDLGRAITPSNVANSSVSFNRLNTSLGGEVIWTPGAGLFDWRLGYTFSGTFFESDDFQRLTNLQHEIRTRGRWRFLPRTAFMFDGRQGFINYPDGTAKTSSHPLRTLIGLNGLVTNNFGLLALAGYGATMYTPRPQEDFDSVIGQAEAKFYLTPNPTTNPLAATLSLSSIAVGFLRDFQDSYVGTYQERDRGYLNLSYFFAGRFLLVVEGGVAAIIYPPSAELGPDPSTDVRIDGSIFGEWRFKDSFGLNSTIRYNANLSDNAFVDETTGETDSLDYQQFEAYIGFRWFM